MKTLLYFLCALFLIDANATVLGQQEVKELFIKMIKASKPNVTVFDSEVTSLNDGFRRYDLDEESVNVTVFFDIFEIQAVFKRGEKTYHYNAMATVEQNFDQRMNHFVNHIYSLEQPTFINEVTERNLNQVVSLNEKQFNSFGFDYQELTTRLKPACRTTLLNIKFELCLDKYWK